MAETNLKKANAKSRIGVIRLSAMGDVAMTLPVLKCLLDSQPDVAITLVTRPFFKPLFSSLERVRIFEVDLDRRHKGLPGLLRLFADLKKEKLTAWADLHQVMRSWVISGLFILSGTKTRLIDKGRREKKKLTRCRNKVFKPLKTTHERYADVFRKLGYHLTLSNAPLNKPDLQQLLQKGWLQKRQVQRIGVAPFAKLASKTYPTDLMKEVLSALSKKPDTEIYLMGAPFERDALNALFEGQKNIFNMAGQMAFADEIALIAHMDVLLSMDSGNGHIAAAFGVPVVTLWGATHPFAGFGPYMQPPSNSLVPDRNQYPCLPTSVFGKTLPKNYEDCMRSIHPNKVVDKVMEVLQQ